MATTIMKTETGRLKTSFWLLFNFIISALVFSLAFQSHQGEFVSLNGMRLLVFPIALIMITVISFGLLILPLVICLVIAIIKSDNRNAVLAGHLALIVYAIASWVFLDNVSF